MKHTRSGLCRALRLAVITGGLASALAIASPGYAAVGEENCFDPEKRVPAIQEPLPWEMGHPLTCDEPI